MVACNKIGLSSVQLNMKHFIIVILLLLGAPGASAQTDYYVPQESDSAHATPHVMTKQESKVARKREKAARKAHKHTSDASGKCYCPYQTSTSIWDDIWNTGIVGTGKAIYQSTIKPQVLGEVVGGVQGAAASSPVPALVGTTAVAIGISEVHKSRRHHRSKQVPQAGVACNCDPCPYHGPRWGPSK